VDQVVDTISAALARQGHSTKAVERWYAEMPREEEMLPKDKYTIFDKKEKTYRKGIHSMSMPWKNSASCARKLANDLSFYFRASQVDSRQPACEPSWFLRARSLQYPYHSPIHHLFSLSPLYRHLYYTLEPRRCATPSTRWLV
jgi:hypothetical protein